MHPRQSWSDPSESWKTQSQNQVFNRPTDSSLRYFWQHDSTLDPLLPLHMSLLVLFLVGMQWMHWIQVNSMYRCLPSRFQSGTNFPHIPGTRKVLRRSWKQDADTGCMYSGFIAAISGHDNGRPKTASYHWSSVLSFGRKKETWRRGALVSIHGWATLAWKIPATTPFRTCCSCWRKLSSGSESQSARIEPVSWRMLSSHGLKMERRRGRKWGRERRDTSPGPTLRAVLEELAGRKEKVQS